MPSAHFEHAVRSGTSSLPRAQPEERHRTTGKINCVRDRQHRRRVHNDPVEVRGCDPNEFCKPGAAREIGGLVSAVASRDKSQVRQCMGDGSGACLRGLWTLHDLKEACLACKIVRKPRMRLAPRIWCRL